MEKLVTRRMTIVRPMRLTRTIKMYSASISGAILEASGGKSAKFVIHLTRNCQITGLIWDIPLSVHLCFWHGCLCHWLMRLLEIATEHDGHETAQKDQREKSTKLHDPGHDERMLIGLRVIVVAVRENVFDRRADAIGRSLIEAEQHVFGRVFDAHVVLGEFAFGRDDLDGAGVRILRNVAAGNRELDILEPDGRCECVDIGLCAGEEVPAVGGLRMPVALEVAALLGCGKIGTFAWI